MLKDIKSSFTIFVAMILLGAGIVTYRVLLFWGFYYLIKWLYLLDARRCERRTLLHISSLFGLIVGPTMFMFWLTIVGKLYANIITFITLLIVLGYYYFFDLDKKKLAKEVRKKEPYYE